MNKKSFYFGTLVLTALALGSCASEDTTTDKTAGKDTPKSGTVFSSETEPATRTSATYTGSGLDFYWTASDKIWVKDDNNTYHQSSEDDIASRIAAVPGSTTTDKAKFWVNGSYTGSTHKVRYTGKNGTKDKVTIKASQTQNIPNDAAHIADDGDFGVADATGSGSYNFTLNHKAAYVTFMPYNANGVIPGAKIQKIRIYTSNTSDQLAGTFDLADNGTLSNGTTTSNSVELNINDFTLPSAYSYTTNGATMVLNPGTYSNVTIEYTLHDAGTNVTGTVKKTYPSVTFDAGKNTPVKSDLRIRVYPANISYQWDAQQHYWAGYEWDGANPKQPILNGGSNTTDAPQSTEFVSSHTLRDFNDIQGYSDATGLAPAVQASYSAKNAPNVNELLWYVEKGNPYLDNETLWSTMGHLRTGGAWFKKLNVIATENSKTVQDLKDKYLDGVDYTRSINIKTIQKDNVQQGKPTNIADYFYLPALPSYHKGVLRIGWLGNYDCSTPSPNDTYNRYTLIFNLSIKRVAMNSGSRLTGMPSFRSSNENEFYPF